ncbi:MAG: hypothetical protein IJA12_01325 [Oscillospiraceae bacterium]|nr:hypothetical protein [Oscillospiraceae bacterium]
MGLFSRIGQKLDSFFEKIVVFTKKLINVMATALKNVAILMGKFFTILTQWIDKAMNYVEATFNVIVSGVQTFLKKVGNEYQEISYNYTKQNDGSYMKNTVVRQTFVSEDEIPADIKALAAKMNDGNMVDMSKTTAQKQEYACNELQIA